jgi:hypothetical protein
VGDEHTEADGPLALATIDDIAAELNRRFEGFVLVCSAEKNNLTDTLQIRRGGAFVMGLGLCKYAEQWMI